MPSARRRSNDDRVHSGNNIHREHRKYLYRVIRARFEISYLLANIRLLGVQAGYYLKVLQVECVKSGAAINGESGDEAVRDAKAC